ncbi:TetR/AcrR family transcriptional regulator [Cohnella rhizosphaerae]|uniref:TetR/AcrR family transcriptional regulator n=1 Tax=Cohnella rhizosphaerae TaxID=1457232 RepID=A0A9X4KUT0_9BACL|nr:TetR/AcrR family transcriptional regulator [Cohnella rhizosphaerae]MDG0811455.1 TetR/AcrR family transcriptional regulator [Cohnella rhizosphaerae]
MNGFEKRAQQIKEKIRVATLDILRDAGPGKLRIADLSKRAGVSQVTIYNYFGSKEALVRDAFKSYVDRAVEAFEAYMREGHSLREQFSHILQLEKDSYRDFPPGLIKRMLADDEELAAYIETVYKEKTIPWTVRIVEDGKAAGEISARVSTEHVLAFIRLYMNQYQTLLEMAESSQDKDGFLEGMVHMFFYGICGKE